APASPGAREIRGPAERSAGPFVFGAGALPAHNAGLVNLPVAGPEPDTPRRAGPRAGPLALHGGVTLLWLLAWYLARVQEYAPHASLWFPPAGVTFAAGLVFGWRG